ncbi:MAG: polysaccharide pyruvyl transferase family protein [Campylobacterota bacterium]|nr:polysaccharide pyruvyl transferase family protein [Campylobacterota bacterium]
MNINNDYNKYFNEHEKYNSTSLNLFWYQKYGKDAWSKGENFGDYLSKVITSEVALSLGLKKNNLSNKKLLAVGSILHFANDDDIIWGSGINGKIPNSNLKFKTLDIRALRGPLTKEVLDKRGLKTSNTFGDPAILLPNFFPQLKYNPIKNKIIVIPNLNEYQECLSLVNNVKLVSPMLHWSDILKEILTSEQVLTSSLHGLIISEAFGVPVSLFKPFGGETMFKYEDYVEGTNRSLTKIPKSFLDGIKIENGVSFSKPHFNKRELISTFPKDVFI